MLNIWDDEEIIAQWKPPEAIETNKWERVYSIRDSMEPEPYAPEQPIPYVVELTRSGLLTIGWDKSMAPP